MPRVIPQAFARSWRAGLFGAGLGLGLLTHMLLAGTASAEITGARYAGPTERYPHAVLGDAIEHDTLVVTLRDGSEQSAKFTRDVVFEDTAPRLVDLDGDGAPEVITVESHTELGARLSIWGLLDGRLVPMAATPHIGQRFRWLAPTGIGAADLDGDGLMELAYVDRPHLAKTLRVWTYRRQGNSVRLEEIASLPGVTNHRIGERDIAGGIRTCGGASNARPEIILADAAWRRLLAVSLQGGTLQARDIGPHAGRSSFASAMACR